VVLTACQSAQRVTRNRRHHFWERPCLPTRNRLLQELQGFDRGPPARVGRPGTPHRRPPSLRAGSGLQLRRRPERWSGAGVSDPIPKPHLRSCGACKIHGWFPLAFILRAVSSICSLLIDDGGVMCSHCGTTRLHRDLVRLWVPGCPAPPACPSAGLLMAFYMHGTRIDTL
jgi:hypothetical protein